MTYAERLAAWTADNRRAIDAHAQQRNYEDGLCAVCGRRWAHQTRRCATCLRHGFKEAGGK